MEENLHKRIIGQENAIAAVSQSIRRTRAGLKDPKRPSGSFIFLGPTGTGKTELAKTLTEFLFGDEQAMITLDMSEYMEKHTVSRLVGSPPGYVGYEEGGQLTEAVRRKPFSVVLFDEIEKAHPDVFNILLQVMDHGTLTDTNGKVADFRQVVLLMTSNVGAREMAGRQVGFSGSEGHVASQGERALERAFSPEFRNRLDARLQFNALDPEVMLRIVDKFVEELKVQLRENKVKVKLTDAGRKALAEEGYDPAFGARPLARVIEEQVKRPLTDELLFGRLEGGGTLTIDAEGGKIALRFEEKKT
jgi:ATP-dependent Clp protease ATP-binding subunit ClpC